MESQRVGHNLKTKEQQIVPPGEFYGHEGDRRATHNFTDKTISQAFFYLLFVLLKIYLLKHILVSR